MPEAGERRLYLLRHAKSSWRDHALSDRERPLSARGRRAAAAVAKHLEGERIRPALVLCSPAARARQTLERVLPALGDPAVELDDSLYGAAGADLLVRIRRLADDVQSALVVGHDPGISELVLRLAAPGRLRDRVATKLPTGALATLEIGCNWSELGPGSARLVALALPRELE